jgi:NADH-ubiquinone oxidoreductase chain 6
MLNLFVTNELSTNGFYSNSLDITSLFIIISGVLIIISKNPIVSVLFLIGLFGGVASYLILLGLNFIGFSYLIVYIGAVSILFLFILMLINIRISELQSNTINSIPLALFIGIFANYSLNQVLPYDLAILNNNFNRENITLNENGIFFASSNNWDGNIIETSHISSIGNILYTSNNMWLILVSLILLLAMVGAIVITIKSNKTSS